MLNNYTSANGSNGASSLKHRTVTIEFVGLPGAGKSTSCKHLLQMLEQNGYKVCTWQNIKDYVREMHFIEKCALVLRVAIFRSPSLILYIKDLFSNSIYSRNSIYRYFRLTLFDVALKQLKKKGKIDIVLLDQWIIQEMWSATIFRARSYNSISKSMFKYYFNTDIVVYFDIDINTAAERIEMRSTNDSRFDRMNAKKRTEELQKYNDYLFQLYESSNCMQKHLFSGLNNPEKNAGLVMEHFKTNHQLLI